MDWPTFSHHPLWVKYGDEVLLGLLNLAWAIIILVIGMWIAGAFARMARNAASKAKHIEPTIVVFFGSVVRYVIMAIVLVAVLQRFGVQTTSIIAVLGAATLAIGLALQGALSNVAAGVLIVLYRPYRIGDYVDILNGKIGTVRDVNIFTTELATLDNVKIVVPNGQIFANAILNYSTSETRRANVEFNVGYEADIPAVIEAVTKVLKDDPRVMQNPQPLVRVLRYKDAVVSLEATAWCRQMNVGALNRELPTLIFNAVRTLNQPFK
jgi:small conductance mechanosensitive channel